MKKKAILKLLLEILEEMDPYEQENFFHDFKRVIENKVERED